MTKSEKLSRMMKQKEENESRDAERKAPHSRGDDRSTLSSKVRTDRKEILATEDRISEDRLSVESQNKESGQSKEIKKPQTKIKKKRVLLDPLA